MKTRVLFIFSFVLFFFASNCNAQIGMAYLKQYKSVRTSSKDESLTSSNISLKDKYRKELQELESAMQKTPSSDTLTITWLNGAKAQLEAQLDELMDEEEYRETMADLERTQIATRQRKIEEEEKNHDQLINQEREGDPFASGTKSQSQPQQPALTNQVVCTTCAGSGQAWIPGLYGGYMGTCGTCNGKGFMTIPYYVPVNAAMQMPVKNGGSSGGTINSGGSSYESTPTRKSNTCQLCNGTGSMIKNDASNPAGRSKYCSECRQTVSGSHYHAPCSSCRGKGSW